jgi:hypothetical protein
MYRYRAFLAIALLFIGFSVCAQTDGAIRLIALGYQHACAITQSSALYCWGGNKFGQVGNGKASADVAAPTLIFPDGVTAVSTGWDETCAIMRGALWCWGDNANDRIGAGPGLNKYIDKPRMIFSKDVTFVTISRDSPQLEHSCAIVAGALRCWGWAYANKPVEIIHAGVTAVDLNPNGDCAVANGALDCWTEQGLQSPEYHIDIPKTAPTVVMPAGVTAVAVGNFHRCAIVRGALWCRGQNSAGEIGNGVKGSYVDKPIRVIDSGVTAVVVTNEASHTCAIANGALLCWGLNFHGWIDPAHYEMNLLPPKSRIGQHAGHGKHGTLDSASSRYDVLTPKTMIASGVTAIAEGANGNLCVVVDAKLRCRGFQRNPQWLGWPDLYTGGLPFDVGIGDIDAIGPDTPARLAAQETRALDSLVPKVAKALQGALISDGQNVFKVFQVDVKVNKDQRFPKIEPHIDAIPLYRILHDGDAVLPDGDGALAFRAALAKDATCGDASNVDGDYAGYAWMSGGAYGLYLQTGDYFTRRGDALHDLTPLSPLLFNDWPEGVAFSRKAVRATDDVFRKFNACADAIQREWSQQPFSAISVGADYDTSAKTADGSNTDDGNTNLSWGTAVSPRIGGVWYSDSGGTDNRVIVKPKRYAEQADFHVDASTVGMMRCGWAWLSKWKQGETLPWKLARNGSQFSLPEWVRDQMDAELPVFPRYTSEELQRAAAAIPEFAGLKDPVQGCKPAVWGDKFTIYYRSRPVERLYVKDPRTPDADSGEPPNPALRLASYAGVGVLPKYAVSKPWPGDPSRTIVALALPEESAGNADNEDAQSFALELLVMKTGSGEVIQRYHEDNAFASDAFEFDGIALDTADYAVKSSIRAIGVRASYDHSGASSADQTTLRLFLPKGRSLKSLLAPLVVSSDSGEGQSDCSSDSSRSVSTVAIGKTFTHGYADLIVRENTTSSKTENCKETHSASTKVWTLRFDGRQYPVPPDLAR